MLSRWPIRNKLVVGLGLLMVILATLSASGFIGLYAYRALVRSVSWRVSELPLATELNKRVGDLRVSHRDGRLLRQFPSYTRTSAPASLQMVRTDFQVKLLDVNKALDDYCAQLRHNEQQKSRIGDSSQEWETVRRIEDTLARINAIDQSGAWLLEDGEHDELEGELQKLQALTVDLPGFLHRNLHEFRYQARSQYRTLIVTTWITSLLVATLLGLFVHLFYRWVFRPLRILIKGSRKVADGQFNYRIRLDSHDEMAELADALNQMTERFCVIKDDLDQQVKQRTREVIRNEQLASVGFLAAGVAHEINNPLASIVFCSDALIGRPEVFERAADEDRKEIEHYLGLIQQEAFRCKEITEKLLDFSRVGDIKRQPTELRETVQSVIDMLQHMGRYQNKHIELLPGAEVTASVNAQEIKQVVLNLLSNALDSIATKEDGGLVSVHLQQRRGFAEIDVRDNGYGMTPEIREQLFEPFFTNKPQNGQQGTGLGLSITYRIVADHGGTIDVASDGPGCGSRFCVRLPVAAQIKEVEHRYQAA